MKGPRTFQRISWLWVYASIWTQ